MTMMLGHHHSERSRFHLADYKEVKATALKAKKEKVQKAAENKEASKPYHEEKKRKADAEKAEAAALKAAQKKVKKSNLMLPS